VGKPRTLNRPPALLHCGHAYHGKGPRTAEWRAWRRLLLLDQGRPRCLRAQGKARLGSRPPVSTFTASGQGARGGASFRAPLGGLVGDGDERLSGGALLALGEGSQQRRAAMAIGEAGAAPWTEAASPGHGRSRGLRVRVVRVVGHRTSIPLLLPGGPWNAHIAREPPAGPALSLCSFSVGSRGAPQQRASRKRYVTRT
jgi:hypothetical protein